MSLSPALVRDVYPRSLLGHAFGLNAMYTSIAAATGPTLGGMMLAILPWQWLFALNLPLALVIVLLARGALPNVGGTGARIDPVSALTSAVGFSAIIYGLDGFARRDPLPLVLAEIVIGAVVFAWFARRQFTLAVPMISLDLFRLPRFSVAAQASFSGWIAFSIGVIALPFFLQLDLGLTPLQSGLLMTSWPIANAVVAPITGHWSDRYAVGWIATGGLITFALALLALCYAIVHPNIALLFVTGLLAGAGWGIFQTPNNREIMGAGPPEKSGSTGAIFASQRVAGQTLGASLAAILFASFAHSAGAHVAPAALQTAVLAAMALATALCVIAAFVSGQRAVRDGFHYHPAA